MGGMKQLKNFWRKHYAPLTMMAHIPLIIGWGEFMASMENYQTFPLALLFSIVGMFLWVFLLIMWLDFWAGKYPSDY